MKAKRVHVSFDDETMEILEIISKKDKRTLSEIVRRMTEGWMERYEDRYWCEIAALKDTGKYKSHEEVWKNV